MQTILKAAKHILKNMKTFYKTLVLIPLFTACNFGEVDRLKEENTKLQDQLGNKDTAIFEFITAMNEIEDNLHEIKKTEGVISVSYHDAEKEESHKEKIIKDIQYINVLMQHNKMEIEDLKKKLLTTSEGLDKAGKQIKELTKLIERLELRITEKDEEISSLKVRLTTLNIAMDSLQVVFVEQTAVVEQQEQKLNRAFYAVGSQKELKEKGVVSKEGGFIGVGKTTTLKNNFNQSYFTEVDITKTNEIEIYSKKAQIITSHPSGSYELVVNNDKVDKIKILDSQAFWSVSKYLVVQVD